MVITIDTDYLFSLKSKKEVDKYCNEVTDNIKNFWEDRDKYDKRKKRKKTDE